MDFDGPGGCWIFQTTQSRKDGYASFGTDIPRPNDPVRRGVTMLAHRFAWLDTYGEEPTGELNHGCYRRRCVRPDHLEVMTRRENLDDGNRQRLQEREALRLLQYMVEGEVFPLLDDAAPLPERAAALRDMIAGR